MKLWVEPWSPEYGASLEAAALTPGDTPVDVNVEVPEASWRPIAPPPGGSLPASVLFVDGVRRVEARVWVEAGDGPARQGICASYAAGAVRCGERAELVAAEVRRGLFTAAPGEAIVTRHGRFELRAVAGDGPEELAVGLQQRMRELEVEVAASVAADAELVVVDGPLTDRQALPGAVGYVKTHQASYLPEAVAGVVGDLRDGERTPLFLATTKWSRYSWFMRLPGPAGHRWAGVVRIEAAADNEIAEAIGIADRVTAALGRFASTAVKDARAPQNLFPIAGLERELHRRLGDRRLMWRSLREAATLPS